MKKTLRIQAIVGFVGFSGLLALMGCSTGMVLGTYPQPHWIKQHISKSETEKSPIQSDSGISIHYDRSNVVFYENELPDGSVRVHYAVVLKNSSGNTVGIRGDQIEIIAEAVPSEVPANQVPKDATDLEGKPIEEQQVSQVSTDRITLSQSADEEPTKAEVEATAAETKPVEASKAVEAPKVKTVKVLIRKVSKVEYKKGDRLSSIPSKVYSRTPVSFQLSKEVVKHFAGSSLPVYLNVPLNSGRSLRLPLWLWRLQ